jgi:hypothetical protein
MIERGPTMTGLTYEEAELYCQFLEYNGHRDWRIPTLDEHSEELTGWYSPQTSVVYRMHVTPVRSI